MTTSSKGKAGSSDLNPGPKDAVAQWRVLRDPPLLGSVNMARDHGLALALLPGRGVLRLYRWLVPTVSFGRNEPALGSYSREAGEREGVDFVRRPTGGRAVLHHLELTYALVFPVRAFGGPKRSYRLINEGLVRGLLALGAKAAVARREGPSLRPDAGPCFRAPSEGEVMALGRKLVGSAQVRIGGSVLQHGSIILDGDQSVLKSLRNDDEDVPSPATLRALLGRVPPLGSLGDSLVEGLAGALGGSWDRGHYRNEEKMAAAELESHYLDSGWTWRV